VQQAAPSDRPPPIAQPLPEPAARSEPVDPSDGEVLQKWGYVMAFSTLIMPILGLVGLVLGIMLATKPHRERHGVAVIAISLALGILAVALWSLLSEN
jgi:phosphotransferase system  glucose/maltose/N-acetylglucosamine-specific IIC component